MKEFIKTRFLFVSTYDVAYGDFMTNSLITNYICDYFDNEILFHYLISDTTSERISWFIENQNISDRTFIHPLHTRFCIEKFKIYPPDYYDYIIIDHCYNELDDILNYFKPKEFLSMHNYPNHSIIKKLYDYLDVKKNHERGYSFGYNFAKLNLKFEELNQGKKYIILYPFSTRGLASINLEGILKINEFAKSKECRLILAGIDANVYSFDNGLSDNLNTFKKNLCLDDNIINLMGLSTSKIINLAKNAEYVFYGPTGSVILPILKLIENKNNYIISGGNSDIAVGVRNTFPDAVESVKNIRPSCPFFPCDVHLFNTTFEESKKLNFENLPNKVRECYQKNNPACLNEELEIKI